MDISKATPKRVEAVAAVPASLRRVVDALPDAMMLLDENWVIIYANETARRISHIQPEYFNQQTLWQLYPDLEGTDLQREYFEARRLGEERRIPDFYYEPFQTWFDVRILPAPPGVAVYYRDVTAVHQADEARDAAARQLREVLEVTTDAVIAIDRNWQVTFVNQRAHEISAPSGKLEGRNFWACFPDALYDGSPYVYHYNRAMREGIGAKFEAFYAEPLNIWVDVAVRPASDGIILFFRDVTEEKQQQRALQDSEQRYRVLTELNPQALWTADAQGRVLYANQTFIEYLGKDFELRNGDEYLARFDPADRQRVLETWTRCVTTGEEYIIDARLIRHSDQASRWWHVRALPLRNADGAIEQWLGVATDVHENRMAAEQLRQQYAEIDRQRRELEAIYSGAPIGMALYEPKDLRIVRINRRQAQILGMAPEEVVGKTFHEINPDIASPYPMIRRAAEGEAMLNQSAEGILPGRPNDYRYFNLNYSPVFAEDGTVQGVAGATIEMTQQKRAEIALIQSEKLAAVGRLAASIAHEINNPLEAVMNLIYLARSYDVAPELKQLLETADQELRRVSIIASQTLRFHRQSSRPHEITCVDLFTTVLGIYEGKLKNVDIRVEKRKRAQKPINCLEGEIRQVLNNLVGNSVDAMPRGGRLLLRSREATEWQSGRKGLVLTIADTGSGIDKLTQARIFEAFFSTKGIGGTGLGLWISAEIVQRHQGKLHIRSSQRPGRSGTVAAMFLPFEAPEHLAPASTPAL